MGYNLGDIVVNARVKEIPLVFWLIPVAIVVNLVQIPIIRADSVRPQWTLHRLSSANVFDPRVLEANETKTTNSLFGVYWTIGNFTPHSTMIVPHSYFIFTPGSAARSKLITLGKIKGFKSIPKPITSESIGPLPSHNIRAISGKHYESAAERKQGKPAIQWSIYLPTSKPSGKILFIENSQKNTWLFIDLSLLPKKLQQMVDV